MPTSTVENYIKRIYLEQQTLGSGLVPFGRLAVAMQVVPGTVTTMVKALSDAGLAVYEPRQGVRLTVAGEKLALHVLRRHRLLESFLVKVLGFDWSEVHAEAEELEHAVSDLVMERIDELLGRPEYDPHGDPIPTATGRMFAPSLRRLSSCSAGAVGTLSRVSDQDPKFLRYATERGLVPGTRVEVLSVDTIGDSITVRVQGNAVTLGRSAAAKIDLAES